MTGRRILNVVVLIVAGLGLAAAGYWWGRRPAGEHTSHATPDKMDDMAGMKGMEAGDADKMGSGAVTVSPDKQQLVGIRTALVESRPLVKKIRTVGIVTYDETKVAQVFTKVEGWIDKLYVDYTGKLVEKGQPLFDLYSPDLVATQDEYLLALQAKESLASSSLKDIRAGSESLLDATRRRLNLWDISDDQIAALQKSRQPKRNLTFYAPMSGFVLKKEAVQGMRVMPDKELYTITDLSTVWVNADIYEYELGNIRLGQSASIALSYYPGEKFTGKVSWISPVLDDKTRTTKVRLEIPNRNFKLKPEMYANVEIDVEGGRKLAIPEEAVLDSGIRKLVFVDKGEGRYAPAEIRVGSKFDRYYEVLSGVSAGEKIIASASFLLDSESRLSEAMGAMAGMPGMEMESAQGKGEMKGTKMEAAAKSGPQEKKTQDLILVLSTQPENAKPGENLVRVKITDKTGKPVNDAKVSLVGAMTMPGMAPFKAEGKFTKDGTYEAKANFAMAGTWDITLSVQRPGQKAIQEKFTVTAQ